MTKYINRKEYIKLYIKGHSDKQMAEHFGVAKSTIEKRRKKFGLPSNYRVKGRLRFRTTETCQKLAHLLDIPQCDVFRVFCESFNQSPQIEVDDRLKKKQSQFDLNLKIIKDTSTDMKEFRREFAIWRLYRYVDVHPDAISRLTGYSKESIKGIIGKIFVMLCKKNKCDLYKFLHK